MLNLWNTRRLADDIVAERVKSSDKGIYYVLMAVFFMVFTYLGAAGPPHYSWVYVYEGVVVCVVTFVGARRVVAAYPDPLDARFFETTFLLAVPLTIKATVAVWVADYGGWWLVERVVDYMVSQMTEPSRALGYWSARAYDLIPFVIAAVVAVVFWLRLAHHVSYVVGKQNG